LGTTSLFDNNEEIHMAGELAGKKIAFLVANEGVEEIELTEPMKAVKNAGAEVHIVAPEVGKVQCMNHMDQSNVYEADRATADVSADDYDGLMLPGGVANPDFLRMDEPAVRLVKQMWEAGKPMAAICHGPWTLVEAGIVKGRTLTSWPSLQTDIRNAGGTWVDEEVHTDAGLVTSRKPDDLEAFCEKMIEEFQEGNHGSRR
jgi:protease I